MPANDDDAFGPEDFGGSDFDDDLLAPHPKTVPAPPKPPVAPRLTTPGVVSATSVGTSAASKADVWACAACNTRWKRDPGPFHTHEAPVPGSKSRVTYSNHPIAKATGAGEG